ncbi:MAG: flagellar biosynthetic protein FliQ [Bryobacteraceae bacterium]|nr:flagellar biosynthetic protein FliQ [Bryobacteraceae bacterium]
MSSQMAVDILRQALMMTFWASLPILAIGFIAGVLLSLVQIVTSMQDSAFSAVPRLAIFLFGLVLLLPWMLNKLIFYTVSLFGDLGRYAR